VIPGQRLEHAGVALGQDAPRSQGQAAQVLAGAGDLGAVAERLGATPLERVGPGQRAGVPLVAGLVAAVAGAGVAEDERGHPVRVPQPEGQRQVAAQGQPAHDGPLGAAGAEDRGHVGHAAGLAVPGRVSG
jgi:hypothetical protein